MSCSVVCVQAWCILPSFQNQMIHLFIGRENGEIDHQLVFYEKKINKKRKMQGAYVGLFGLAWATCLVKSVALIAGNRTNEVHHHNSNRPDRMGIGVGGAAAAASEIQKQPIAAAPHACSK
jgi:hypothetical protein